MTAPHDIPPLISAARIRRRVLALAVEIAGDYGQADFSIVTILKGGFVFTADLIRALAGLNVHPIVDFVTFSSYGAGTTSSRQVTLKQELSLPVKGLRILLIDDILDTGLTTLTAKRLLLEQGAAEVRVCVLLDKPSRREVSITADYTGFEIDNVFVVGYGLDFNNRYRELPDLKVLTPDSPS